MSRTARLLGCVALALAAGAMGTPAAGADVRPELDAPEGRWRLGDAVTVTGQGFVPGEQVTVDVCGARAAHGTEDCSLTSQTSVMVWRDGSLHARVVVRRPARPCPCVVVATGLESGVVASRVVRIAGVPTRRVAPASAVTGTAIRVDARLTGDRAWGEFFGWPARRRLELYVRSVPGVPVALQVSQGRGSQVDRFVAGRVLPPGREGGQSVSVPIEFGAFGWGTRHVTGRVQALDAETSFDATTTVRPWGLLLVVAAVGMLAAGWLRRSRGAPPGSAVSESSEVAPAS